MSQDNEVIEHDLIPAVKALSDKCHTILKACTERQEKASIAGLYRFTQALTAESHFLDKLLNKPSLIKRKYIASTNLSYLESVYEAIQQINTIDELMRNIGVPPINGEWMSQANILRKHSIKLDLVTEHERVWIKIFARNTKAIRHDMDGLEWGDDDSEDDSDFEYDDGFQDDHDDSNPMQAHFDHLPIFKKAKTYLRCAQLYQYHYKPPVIVFAFMKVKENEDPYVQKIMDRLKEMGICVYLQQDDNNNNNSNLRSHYLPYLIENGWDEASIDLTSTTIDVSSLTINDNKDNNESDRKNEEIAYSLTTKQLNLDVSTVLAIISELSHHGCQVDEVDGEALKLQASMELKHVILNDLEKILKGKELFMTQCAFDRLKSIIDVVAGPLEKKRFYYLFPNEKKENDDNEKEIEDDLWTNLTPPNLPIIIIPDEPSLRFKQLLELPPKSAKRQPGSKLNNGRKIRCRFTDFHANIFGTADTHQMSSVTAIQWMPFALAEAGITGTSMVIHDPRSLAEQKMHVNKK
ncbi:unnamed protein product [Cunninghamella blakesleeana]